MDAEPQRAAAQLRALMARTRAAVDRVVGSWHVHQLLGLLAQLEADQGNAAAAAELDERAATDPSPVYDQLVAMVRHVRQRESPSGA
jgi:hypothetical protein